MNLFTVLSSNETAVWQNIGDYTTTQKVNKSMYSFVYFASNSLLVNQSNTTNHKYMYICSLYLDIRVLQGFRY